jgi:hypothetical protein
VSEVESDGDSDAEESDMPEEREAEIASDLVGRQTKKTFSLNNMDSSVVCSKYSLELTQRLHPISTRTSEGKESSDSKATIAFR